MRRPIGILLIVLGALAVVAAPVWAAVAPDRLLRFPSDLNKTLHYTGTATTYVDPTSGAPLSTPLALPLSIDRHLQATESSSSKVVIDEHIATMFGGRSLDEQHQYVMDRKSMKFVDDPRSWAYDPANPVDRSGSYRINFPRNTATDGQYTVWNNETEGTYTVSGGTGPAKNETAGVDTTQFSATYTHDVAPYELVRLKAAGLPTELTPAQLTAQLAAQGVDVQALLAQAATILTPQELSTAAAAIAKPIPLRYQFTFEGQVSIEPRTGAVIDIHATSEGFEASPDVSGLAPLAQVLAAHSNIPAVATAVGKLQALAAQPPQKVLGLSYQATPATVADIGSDASGKAGQIRLVETTVPWTLGIAGGVVLLVGLVLVFWPKRRGPVAPEATTDGVVPAERGHRRRPAAQQPAATGGGTTS